MQPWRLTVLGFATLPAGFLGGGAGGFGVHGLKAVGIQGGVIC